MAHHSNNKKEARRKAINAAAHKANVLAAAAADRHAKAFTAMFSIDAPASNLQPTAQYLADLNS